MVWVKKFAHNDFLKSRIYPRPLGEVGVKKVLDAGRNSNFTAVAKFRSLKQEISCKPQSTDYDEATRAAHGDRHDGGTDTSPGANMSSNTSPPPL